MERGDERPRILVVDDDADILGIMAELFEEEGFETIAESTHHGALERIREQAFETVVTDVNLDGKDGLEILRAARAADPEAVVVLVTGFASVSTAVSALREGAFDYIPKPFDLDTLALVVSRGREQRRLVLENRRLVDSLTRANERLRRHEEELAAEVADATRRLRGLLDAGREITRNLDLPSTLEVVVACGSQLVNARAGYLYLMQPKTGELRLEAVTPGAPSAPQSLLDGALAETASARRAFRWRALADGVVEDAFLAETGAKCALVVPLGLDEASAGAFAVVDAERAEFGAEDEELLTLFALQAQNAVGNAAVHQRLKNVEELKSDFVAIVSHELRTPLTAINGALGLVSDEGAEGLSSTQEELLDVAMINTRRLLAIVNDVLDFSRLEASRLPMNFEAIRPEEPVEAAVKSLSGLARDQGIRLETSFEHEIPEIVADKVRVEQVLTNLISNAIKFSTSGSKVDVSVAPDGSGVRISVRDEGCGIDEADIPNLFQRLRQLSPSTTREAGGAGLGLVISRAIVEAHDGRIDVASRPGQGSVFVVHLPREPSVRRRSARERENAERG